MKTYRITLLIGAVLIIAAAAAFLAAGLPAGTAVGELPARGPVVMDCDFDRYFGGSDGDRFTDLQNYLPITGEDCPPIH